MVGRQTELYVCKYEKRTELFVMIATRVPCGYPTLYTTPQEEDAIQHDICNSRFSHLVCNVMCSRPFSVAGMQV